MKKFLFFTLFFFPTQHGFCQTYMPMPSDSAIWRYRIYDIGAFTQVLDNVLFLNGSDTIKNGNTYHKIMSRSYIDMVPNGTVPPIVPITANRGDIVYGGIRESGKQVFLLELSGEQLIYDFNVAVGDSIPAYNGKKMVTVIDSIFIGGVYRKRYLTTDTAYYVIEGIGSSEGLIPDLNDGFGAVQFMCFTDTPITYSPDITVPCTYVYPIGYGTGVYNVNEPLQQIKVFPVPASDVLHVTFSGSKVVYAVIFNSMGQMVWICEVSSEQEIPVSSWDKGVYYLRVNDDYANSIVKKIIVQ